MARLVQPAPGILESKGKYEMAVNIFPSFVTPRYRLIEHLGSGGMGEVYRAFDRLNRQDVALKRVLTRTEPPNPKAHAGDTQNLRVALTHEFQTLASLRHPNVIEVLDYGFDQKQPYFTMDLLVNPRTILEAGSETGSPGSVKEKIALVVQLLQALAYLHRRGILHRDVKPSNILVTPAGQVRVLDFGLAINDERAKRPDDSTGGTLAYMAPELLRDEQPSAASDLYAVGVIACELLTGQHPFNSPDTSGFLTRVLTAPPQLKGIDPDSLLALVLYRLLEKSAAARYTDAGEVIRAVQHAIGEPVVIDSYAIRESYLQAARFVGREQEMGDLAQSLQDAMDGKRKAVLIGGESGVGKSRLVSELQTLALVKGVMVLRGQAISEARALYHLWYDVFRRLVILTQVTDQEAGILKAVLPDIAEVLERPIPDAPELEPKATQERLLATVNDIFNRQTQPMVILLEDLQWMDDASREILVRLTRQDAPLPLLVVGNYRDDEKSNLPTLLPDMRVIRLARLSKSGIMALSESMLGSTGSRPPIVALLEQETEGNAFFLVEVVRALADEAGQLDKIGDITLRENVITGGIQRILQRRLNLIPPQYQSLLRLAAVAGRQLDLAILSVLGPDIKLDDWLSACAESNILARQNEYWRFAHDKLRESLLSEISPQERRSLHRQVAEAIEKVYPGVASHVAILAYHWAQVAESESADPATLTKAMTYAQQAGEQATQNHINQEATVLLRQALQFLNRLPDNPQRAEQELTLQIDLSKPLTKLLGWSNAQVKAVYDRAHQLVGQVGETSQRLPVLVGLYVFYLTRADMRVTQELAQQITVLADKSQDSLPTQIASNYVQGDTLFWLGEFPQSHEYFNKALKFYSLSPQFQAGMFDEQGVVCHCYKADLLTLLGYPEQAIPYLAQGLAMAQAIADPTSLAYIHFHSTVVYGLQRNWDAFDQSLNALRTVSNEHELLAWSSAALIIGGWRQIDRDGGSEGIAAIQRGLGIHEAIGLAFTKSYALNYLGRAYHKLGQLAESLAALDRAVEFAQTSKIEWIASETWRLKAECLQALPADRWAEAEACYQKSLEITRRLGAKLLELKTSLSLAQWRIKQGKREEARQLLEPVYLWFTEGFEMPDLKEAKQLLDLLKQPLTPSGNDQPLPTPAGESV